jgi:hypothetical protein
MIGSGRPRKAEELAVAMIVAGSFLLLRTLEENRSQVGLSGSSIASGTAAGLRVAT